MARRDISTPIVGLYLGVFWTGVALLGVYITSNGAPSAPELKWAEEPVMTITKLELQIATESVDPDGDSIDYTFVWKRNGVVDETKSSKTVPAKDTRSGDTWDVIVTPNDGTFEGWGCGLPWRDCAGAISATASVTIQNTPPTARLRFIGAEEAEITSYDGKSDVSLQLSCVDADAMNNDRDEAAARRAAGSPPFTPEELAARPDPCTYTVAWWPADATPAEGEVSEYTGLMLDKKTLASSKAGWKVSVVANDGEADGPLVEFELLPAEG